jgi:predicted PurR-regulated permease PerM
MVSISIGCLLLALLLWYSLHVLLVVFAGILVAVALVGMSNLVGEMTKLTHGWSLTIVLLVVTSVLAGVGWILVPPLIIQLSQLGEQLPAAVESLKQSLGATEIGSVIVDRLPSGESVVGWRDQHLGRLGTVLSGLVGAIVTTVVIVAIGTVKGDIHLFDGGTQRLHEVPFRWHGDRKRWMSHLTVSTHPAGP